MKKTALIILGIVATFCCGFSVKGLVTTPSQEAMNPRAFEMGKEKKQQPMKLGAFSISLNVKDLYVSKRFYESLGFTEFAGGMDKHYLIMKNGNALIGLFHGMFEGHILTFNPGWDENAKNVKKFDDVREIQRHLKGQGIPMSMEADEKTTGPGSIMLSDPDGNVILIDQHR